LPDDAVSDHEGGWGTYLGRLERLMRGDVPEPEIVPSHS